MIISGNLLAREQSTSYLAPGSNQWIDFQSLGGTSLFVVDSINERVGIHTPNPEFDLHIVDDRGNKARVGISQYDDTPADGPDLILQRYRGNVAGASGLIDGDRLCGNFFKIISNFNSYINCI